MSCLCLLHLLCCLARSQPVGVSVSLAEHWRPRHPQALTAVTRVLHRSVHGAIQHYVCRIDDAATGVELGIRIRIRRRCQWRSSAWTRHRPLRTTKQCGNHRLPR